MTRASLRARLTFYEEIKKDNGLEAAEWTCFMFGEISKNEVQLADYLFACDALCMHKKWDILKELQRGLLNLDIYAWEQAMERILRIGNCPTLVLLEFILQASLVLKFDMNTMNMYSHPTITFMLQTILLRPQEENIEALDMLFKFNPVGAGQISSAMLRCLLESALRESKPQAIFEPDSPSHIFNTKIWEWKTKHNLSTSHDLAEYMMYLVYMRQSSKALELFDSKPKLHSKKYRHIELLAAIGASDYIRIQKLFDEVEGDHQYFIQSKQEYTAVVRAMGFLGKGNSLEEIYSQIKPEDLTRGLFHAMIFSNTVIGDLDKVKMNYDRMMEHGIIPSDSTFNIVLQAYVDSRDIKGALMFLLNEMLAKHQRQLRNKEVSLILKICAVRRDYKMASVIWTWASELIQLDGICHSVYLQCLLDCNQFGKALELFEKLKKKKMIRIEMITTLIRAAGRSDDPQKLFDYALETVIKEQMTMDSQYFLACLTASVELKDTGMFKRTLHLMKKMKIPLRLSHYTKKIEWFSKFKRVDLCENEFNTVVEENIIFDYHFLSCYLQALCGPGSENHNHQTALEFAKNLVSNNKFTLYSALLPRTVTPVNVIEPVIRLMFKQKRYRRARELLDSLLKQRKEVGLTRDSYQIHMLYLELAVNENNYTNVANIWNRFESEIRVLFVLDTPGSETSKPIYKLPPRYRHDYWMAVNAKIIQLKIDNKVDELLDFPRVLHEMGLQMNHKNCSNYIEALLTVGSFSEAFKFAKKRYIADPDFQFSNSCFHAMVLAIKEKKVNYRTYGKLGFKLNAKAKAIT